MDLNLAGKNVLITGGASNIGRAIVHGFVAEGARVTLADIDDKQAETVADEAPADTVITRHTDVTDPDSVNATVEHMIATLGGIDVLVNCAGWTVDRLFLDKPREEWQKEVDIDFWGFVNLTRAVLPHMVERGAGNVVSIASDAGRIGEWREAVYSGTKAGVIAMSKAIAKEVGRHGIRLNVICPGFTPGKPENSGQGSIWQAEQGAQFPEQVLTKIARSYPLRRLGTPEDVVAPTLMFASDTASSYITGQTLSVSGGYTML